MRRLTLTFGAVALCACGTENSVSGTVQGTPLPAKDALLLQGTEIFGGVSSTFAAVALLNFSNACATTQADLAADKDKPNVTDLAIAVVSLTNIEAGTYPITTQSVPAATASFSATDATCGTTLNVQATGGSVTFNSLTASQATGSFNLTFGSDTLTGSFNASNCSVSFNTSADAGTFSCTG
jgi:hypothetical protein